MITADNTMTEYLTRVSIFLKQELPTKYWSAISVGHDIIIIRLNELNKPFNDVYGELQALIELVIFGS
jgi:hypothetical protein